MDGGIQREIRLFRTVIAARTLYRNVIEARWVHSNDHAPCMVVRKRGCTGYELNGAARAQNRDLWIRSTEIRSP